MGPTQTPPKIQLANRDDYRETYANSVQVRMSLGDFLLMFGIAQQTGVDSVTIHNFQGVFLSPQQAKALLNVLQTNIGQYEATFGEINLEPRDQQGTIQ